MDFIDWEICQTYHNELVVEYEAHQLEKQKDQLVPSIGLGKTLPRS